MPGSSPAGITAADLLKSASTTLAKPVLPAATRATDNVVQPTKSVKTANAFVHLQINAKIFAAEVENSVTSKTVSAEPVVPRTPPDAEVHVAQVIRRAVTMCAQWFVLAELHHVAESAVDSTKFATMGNAVVLTNVEITVVRETSSVTLITAAS